MTVFAFAFDLSENDSSLTALSNDGVERRVGQVMISGATTASNIPVPLCEKGAVERDEAINVSLFRCLFPPLFEISL
jgi:hypothetical protein